jgi:hypothetical protein
VFEKRVLRRVFGPKRDHATGEWRKLHNEELKDVLGAVAYLQVSPLGGGSRDETWRGQGISKRSVSWNLPKFDICRVTKGAHIQHL